jgi:hypothetical protein
MPGAFRNLSDEAANDQTPVDVPVDEAEAQNEEPVTDAPDATPEDKGDE